MPLVTTVDCERIVPNRFALVRIAAARARNLHRGAAPRVPPNSDVPILIALREIAAGAIDPGMLQQPREQPDRRERVDGPSGAFGPSSYSASEFGSAPARLPMPPRALPAGGNHP